MTTKKKLTASILIISLFMCLPEPEAKAAGDADDSIFAATIFDFPINDSRQADCTGLYSIFSPCYTLQINTISNYGN